MTELVILAGGTGDLGGRIARALRDRGAAVRALVRPRTGPDQTRALTGLGCEIAAVDFADAPALAAACRGAACVVSALSGLEEVIVTAQAQLLDAAVAAGVPRFIPSDFSVDYRNIPADENRNFALRKRFRERVDAAPIQATSIWNGAFMDMVAGQMPLIIRPLRRVAWLGRRDRKLQMTTKDDTAAFAAAAALDRQAPRDLHIAGAEVTVDDIARIMTELTGKRYRPLHALSLAGIKRLITLVRALSPASNSPFPAWQGMQYLHNMFAGYAPTAGTDNARYPGIRFTSLREVLAREEKP